MRRYSPPANRPTIGHTLPSVFLDSGQLRSRQDLDATDELWTAAKARPDLGVAGPCLPPGEDSPFQRPEHLWVGRRTRPTLGPRTKGQDLEHTPSAAPESPGHLGRIDTPRYEVAYPPLNRPQVCFAGCKLGFDHCSTISGDSYLVCLVESGVANTVEMSLVGAGRSGREVRAGQAAGSPILGDPGRFLHPTVAGCVCRSRSRFIQTLEILMRGSLSAKIVQTVGERMLS
jgi:hypothetical protein